MSHFLDRINREHPQAEAFEAWLKERGAYFIRTAQEDAQGNLHANTPDYLVLEPGKAACFVELKNTPAISRKSYSYCLSLDEKTPTYFLVNSEGKKAHRGIGFYLIRARDVRFWTKEDAKENGHTKQVYSNDSDIWRTDYTKQEGSGQVYGSVIYKSNSTYLPEMTGIYISKLKTAVCNN